MGQPCGGRVERHRASGVETLKTAMACHYPWRFAPLARTLGKFVTQWISESEEGTNSPMTIQQLLELGVLVYEPISTFSLPHCWGEGHPV